MEGDTGGRSAGCDLIDVEDVVFSLLTCLYVWRAAQRFFLGVGSSSKAQSVFHLY